MRETQPKNQTRDRAARRGLSPVVGTAMMVVIVVLLAVAAAAMALGMTDQLVDPEPVAAIQGDVSVGVSGGSVSHELVITSEGGQSIPVEHVSVVVEDGETLPIEKS